MEYIILCFMCFATGPQTRSDAFCLSSSFSWFFSYFWPLSVNWQRFGNQHPGMDTTTPEITLQIWWEKSYRILGLSERRAKRSERLVKWRKLRNRINFHMKWHYRWNDVEKDTFTRMNGHNVVFVPPPPLLYSSSTCLSLPTTLTVQLSECFTSMSKCVCHMVESQLAQDSEYFSTILSSPTHHPRRTQFRLNKLRLKCSTN